MRTDLKQSSLEKTELQLVDLLFSLESKFQSKTKKSATLLEKQIIQLVINYHIEDCDIFDNTLYFRLPHSGELGSIGLSWPVDLNPDIKNKIKRNQNKIEIRLKNPNKYNWNKFLLKTPELLSLEEVFNLKSLNLIDKKTWESLLSGNVFFYNKNRQISLSPSEYVSKLRSLLFRWNEEKKNYKERAGFKTLKYENSLFVFNAKEKDFFRKRVKEHHHFQPNLIKIRGTLVEAILNESLIFSNKSKTVFYEEESHKAGFDIEVVNNRFQGVKISSKTGNISTKGLIHLSSSRTQKTPELQDKIIYINNELDEISLITACVLDPQDNKKIYERLSLNPEKLKVSSNSVDWETTFKNGKWTKFTYKSESGLIVTITKGKSEQVDYFVPRNWFDVIDRFEI